MWKSVQYNSRHSTNAMFIAVGPWQKNLKVRIVTLIFATERFLGFMKNFSLMIVENHILTCSIISLSFVEY